MHFTARFSPLFAHVPTAAVKGIFRNAGYRLAALLNSYYGNAQ